MNTFTSNTLDVSLATHTHEPAPDEAELVRRLKAGDSRAFETLVHEYGGRVLTVARRFFPCEQDAADAVQDAFFSAFGHIGEFASQARLATWLHRIVVNACLMKLRSRARRREVQTEDHVAAFDAQGSHVRPVAQWSPEGCEVASTMELKAHVRRCIDELPDSYRTVLLLRDIEEHDTAETARLLGESQANVKTRLHRARLALRAKIEPIVLAN